MRRLITDFYRVRSNPRGILPRFALGGILCALAAACVLALEPAVAREAPRDQVAIPECLQKLNLTPQQQDQVKEIVRDYDADITSVWGQFSDCYRNTIRTETLLLTAIEDNLTDAQRTQVRAQRRKVAQREKSLAGTNTKPNQATSQPASAVEESNAVVGVSLTPEQEATADKVQEKYLSRLRSLNRDIQGLHTRLVSLEADKLVEIEKVLTKDQLKQLCESRQNAPPAVLKTAATESAATKTD